MRITLLVRWIFHCVHVAFPTNLPQWMYKKRSNIFWIISTTPHHNNRKKTVPQLNIVSTIIDITMYASNINTKSAQPNNSSTATRRPAKRSSTPFAHGSCAQQQQQQPTTCSQINCENIDFLIKNPFAKGASVHVGYDDTEHLPHYALWAVCAFLRWAQRCRQWRQHQRGDGDGDHRQRNDDCCVI